MTTVATTTMKIGTILPIGQDAEADRPLPYGAIREMALQAEAAGFDSLWLPDHLLFRFPDQSQFGIWECWTLLTALAEATERIELGTLVLCLPFRNPAVLAKMAVTLDEVAGGRLILGLGAGWHQPEFDAIGASFERLVDQFEEGLQIITPLVHEGAVDFHGTYFSAPNCEMLPPSTREGGVPVMIASRGPRMLRLTARYADQWNWAWSGRPTNYLTKHAELLDACAAEGRDPATLTITVGLLIVFPEHLTEELPASYSDPDRALRGTTEELAEGLLAYAGLGVDHLICQPVPNTAATQAELARVLHLARERMAAGAA